MTILHFVFVRLISYPWFLTYVLSAPLFLLPTPSLSPRDLASLINAEACLAEVFYSFRIKVTRP